MEIELKPKTPVVVIPSTFEAKNERPFFIRFFCRNAINVKQLGPAKPEDNVPVPTAAVSVKVEEKPAPPTDPSICLRCRQPVLRTQQR